MASTSISGLSVKKALHRYSMPLNLRDAGDLGLRFHGRWGIQLGVPAHQGEAGLADGVGYEDAEAHGGERGAYQHYQIEEILHTSPLRV